MKFYLNNSKITKKAAMEIITKDQLAMAREAHEMDPLEQQSFYTSKGMITIEFQKLNDPGPSGPLPKGDMKMTKLENKMIQMSEILEVVQTEFFEEDGIHYGMDVSEWDYYNWLAWLQIAIEAVDARWSNKAMMFAADFLSKSYF